jgi:hypothetical protein
MILGPLNGGLGLLSVLIAVGTVIFALRRLHRGEPVPLVPLVVALVLPLLLATWAGTFQHEASMDWAMNHPNHPVRQTWMAAMLARTIGTQLYAGLTVAGAGLALLIGAVALTVRGERPRWLLGALGLGLGAALLAVVAISMSSHPPSLVGLRVGMYAVAVGVSIAALVGAHRRGPGAQLATLAAIAVPLIVVGADLATLGSVATSHLKAIVVAAPADKQAMMTVLIGILDALRGSSWLTLGLATALALLAPVAAWRKERPLAVGTLVAIAVIVAVTGAGLGTATLWMDALR